MPDPYDVWDRPPCWVLHEGVWCPGRVLQWLRGEAWSAVVRYEYGGLQYEQQVPGERLRDRAGPKPEDEAGGSAAPPWLDE